MAKSDKKTEKKKELPVKLVSDNRKAKFNYEIMDSLECGIALVGSEVKSLRNGKLSLEESYARVKDGAVWLVGADIAEYPQATIWNHAPKRPRKLLMKQAALPTDIARGVLASQITFESASPVAFSDRNHRCCPGDMSPSAARPHPVPSRRLARTQ